MSSTFPFLPAIKYWTRSAWGHPQLFTMATPYIAYIVDCQFHILHILSNPTMGGKYYKWWGQCIHSNMMKVNCFGTLPTRVRSKGEAVLAIGLRFLQFGLDLIRSSIWWLDLNDGSVPMDHLTNGWVWLKTIDIPFYPLFVVRRKTL